ncbi:unnamed protein product [Lupinus luteus]|uniref:Uncharacterized protein n=1 Tax=Lupinus luteus TaxID=3873 RepID=A0AAV1XA09_LUPLU
MNRNIGNLVRLETSIFVTPQDSCAWFIGLDVKHIDDRKICCGTPPGEKIIETATTPMRGHASHCDSGCLSHGRRHSSLFNCVQGRVCCFSRRQSRGSTDTATEIHPDAVTPRVCGTSKPRSPPISIFIRSKRLEYSISPCSNLVAPW